MKLYAVIGEGWAGDYEEDSDRLLYTLPKVFFSDKKKAYALVDKWNKGDGGDDDFYDHHYTWTVHEYVIDEVKGRKKK